MGISIADNFNIQMKKPLDGRTSYATLALMKAVTDANIYEGCEAYCAETDKYYKFLSTNTVDEYTGKWREREDSAGHIIEDNEGTALTQRDTMQFGEGFSVDDDSENEKTVISHDVMPSEDMSEVITPLPSTRKGYHKYNTEEQIVGEWIDGSTLYQRTVVLDSGLSFADTGVTKTFSILDATNLSIKKMEGTYYFTYASTNHTYVFTLGHEYTQNNDTVPSYLNSSLCFQNDDDGKYVVARIKQSMSTLGSVHTLHNIIVTVQYTKTT